ncbi:MAG: DsbE family thiol:disulfide interchange protein [Gammaproteobacteria bacterium]|nr:DsbE family thiol:disulfide interchange protein [Gammaproteobacteria bacterium]
MNRFAIPLLVFALMFVFFWFGLGRDPTVVPSPLIGKPAPAFSLPRLDNPELALTDAALRGQYSLVNVWGTWCVGCRQEHDVLLAIAASGVVPIFGLNWKDDTLQAKDWLQQLGDPYAVTGVDADGTVAIDWGVYGAPETFLIGPDGTVLYKHIAPLTMEIWETEFLPRIQDGQGGAS